MEGIKAIIVFKKKLFSKSIDKIYFDTYGKYQFVRLAESKSTWDVEYSFHYYSKYEKILLYNNKQLKYESEFLPYFSNMLVIRYNDYVIYKLSKLKENVFLINFDKTKFEHEDIFYITDKIIRLVGNKLLPFEEKMNYDNFTYT